MKRVGAATALVIAVVAAVVLWPSDGHKTSTNQRTIVATIHPVAAILREIAGERLEVVRLLPPAASPHTFSPKPGDVRAAEEARAVFYAADELDGWASRLGQRRVALFPFVPEELRCEAVEHDHAHGHDGEDGDEHEGEHADNDHDHEASHEHPTAHGGSDPHFWTDPLAVRAIVPRVVEELSTLDPEGRATYEANGARFVEQLRALDVELRQTLAPARGKPVFLFHPSLCYLIRRYDLHYAGVVEAYPGKAPSPKYIQELTERFASLGATALFVEPQLSRRPAEVIANEVKNADIRVYELDPIGGVEGRMTYFELIRYNANVLAEALR